LCINSFQIENDLPLETSFTLPSPNPNAAIVGLNKYAQVQPQVDELAFEQAISFLDAHFSLYMSDSIILSNDESLQTLDLTTSPGCFLNVNCKTKREALETYPELPAHFEELWSTLLKDDYYFVWTNSLKEEVRKKGKDMRVFMATPFEAAVLGNRLFYDMNNKFYDSHLKTASTVGLCPFYGGWNDLYTKLSKFEDGFDMDAEKFDSRIFILVMFSIARFRFRCLRSELRTPENYVRVMYYYKNIVISVLESLSEVIMKLTGNPSGSINTISDNTLIIYVFLAYAWCILVPEEFRNYYSFNKNVVPALQGDDNTITVHPDFVKYFNAEAIIQVLGTINVTFTTECTKPRPVKDLSFLSSSFDKFINGKCVYCLNPEKLIESLKWSKYPRDPIMCLIRVGAMLRVCWPNQSMRQLCRMIVNFLLREYDSVFQHDDNWKIAKTEIRSDREYLLFFTSDVGGTMDIWQPYKNQIQEIENDVINMAKECLGEKVVAEVLSSSVAENDKDREICEVRVCEYTNHKGGGNAVGKAVAEGIKAGVRAVKARKPQRQANRAARKKRRQERRAGRKQKRQNRRAFRRGGDQGRTITDNGGGVMIQETPNFVSMASELRTRPARWFGNGKGPGIHHTELITTLKGTASFTKSYAIELNPGLQKYFPWVSQLAGNFDQYVMKKMRLHFKTLTNYQEKGVFYAVPIYDASSTSPSSKEQLSAFPGMKEINSFRNGVMDFYPNRSRSFLDRYIRTGVLASNLDIKTYDYGRIEIFSVGQTDVTNDMMEVYAEYIFEFRNAHFVPIDKQVFGGRVTCSTGVSLANPFGTAPAYDAETIGYSVLNNLVTFENVGYYIVSIQCTGTGLTFFSYGGTGISTLPLYLVTSGTGMIAVSRIRVLSANGVLTIAGNGTTLTNTDMTVSVTPDNSVSVSDQKKMSLEDRLSMLEAYLAKQNAKMDDFVKLPDLNKRSKSKDKLAVKTKHCESDDD